MRYLSIRKFAPALCLGVMCSGCIDDDYDLSDVDTTVRVSVDDLVVPINLNEATLKSMLGLDPEPEPDSKIQVVNGQYAFVQDGSFSSEVISISAVSLPKPVIDATVATIDLGGLSTLGRAAGSVVSVDVPVSQTHLSTSTDNVSDCIVKLGRITTNFNVSISMSLPELAGVIGKASFEGLSFKLPKGMTISGEGTYDPSTGIYEASSVPVTNGRAAVSFDVKAIDCEQAGVELDAAQASITFSDDLGIVGGVLSLDLSSLGSAALPSSCTLTTAYEFGNIPVLTFSGEMKYTLDGFSISDVSLDDLPDVLTQQGTDLLIANPQIYFDVTNPLAPYSIKAQTGFEITSYVDESKVGSYKLDEPYFTINGTPGVTKYAYYLSPREVDATYPGYEGAEHVGYASLSNVLGGDRVPTRLSIDFTSPEMPVQPVSEMPLGVDLGDVSGHYVFCAPLAFATGARIVYSDALDGWWSEDLDAVTIERLDVNAVVSTDLPVGVHFTGYPIDRNGNQIDGVNIEGADIAAGASGAQLHISITGAVKGLDGIRFEATVAADADTEALTPDMTIKLTDIRPCVSGYYTKEL